MQLKFPTLSLHGTGWRLESAPNTVPNNNDDVEAPINSRNPRIMRPTHVVIFMLVSQNSISPYLRTLKKLKVIGAMRYNEIHKAGLNCAVELQKDMRLAAATRGVGIPSA